MAESGVFREVKRNSPCPICGHDGWCCWSTDKQGYDEIICKRYNVKQNVLGGDGQSYVFSRVSSSGNLIFQELSQKIESYNLWRQQNGYKPKNSLGQDSASYRPVAKPRERQMTILDRVSPKSHKELDKIYRSILDDLILEENHRKYLVEEGWSNNLIEKNLIRSFPEKDFSRDRYKNYFSKSLYRKGLAAKQIEKFGENALLGVPGAYKDRGGHWTFAGPKGILFPLYDTNGYIFGLRIRMDFMDVNAKLTHVAGGDSYFTDAQGVKKYLQPLKGTYELVNGQKVWGKDSGKYRPLQSFYRDEEEYKKGFIKNSYDCGCGVGDQVGVYFHPERDKSFLCYITEGEKKGIYANDVLQAPVVSVPGVDSWSKLFKGQPGERIVDRLKARGIQMFVVAYDADKAKNEKVLAQEKNVVDALRAEGFRIGTAEWDIELGKGLDDLLAGGHKPGYALAE